MRPRIAFVVAGLALATVHSGAQQPPASPIKAMRELLATSTETQPIIASLDAPLAPPVSASELPKSSMTEPFAIGEALYDEARLDDAVVSMLTLMGVAIVPDTSERAPVGTTGLVLSESEVHALVSMGREDLASADDIENLPYSLGDLHAVIGGLLPAFSLEDLADTYTRAYETNPDDPMAKAMLGRPVDPDIKITRTQMWFLLMDGFADAVVANPRWGTADRNLPDVPSPNAQWSDVEWREVLARVPLLSADRFVRATAPDPITQSSTPNAAPVEITLRAASAPALTSRLTGRTLIAARPGSLSGLEVTWQVQEDSALGEVGTIASPIDEPTRIGSDGVAHLIIRPRVDATSGSGQVVEEWDTIEARFDTRGLVASAYAVPPPLTGLLVGSSTARVNVRARWRTSDVLHLLLVNNYSDVNFDIPGLGGATRDGLDVFSAILSKRSNGTYAGEGPGSVHIRQQTLRGPFGVSACQHRDLKWRQRLRVVARATQNRDVTGRLEFPHGFGATRSPDTSWWIDTAWGPLRTLEDDQPDGGYLALEFLPVTPPDAPPAVNPTDRSLDCVPYIRVEGDRRSRAKVKTFIPFNDAQWTTPGQGYPIALRARGATRYGDLSSHDPLTGRLAGLQGAFRLTGSSAWAIIVTRTREDFRRELEYMDSLPSTPATGP